MPIAKLSEDDPDFQHYRTICVCTDSAHDLDIMLSVGQWWNLQTPEIELYANMTSKKNNLALGFFGEIWWRMKTAVKLLWRGEIEMQHCIVLRPEDVTALGKLFTDGVEALEIHKKKS